MLTNSEVADLSPELAHQKTIASLGLSVNQYVKTLQGKQMILSQEMFALNGTVYQGYNQSAVQVSETLCTDEEIEKLHDIDGSKQKVVDQRRARLAGSRQAKDREQRENERKKIAQQRDELELKKLLREEAARVAGSPDEPEPEPEVEPEPEIHACNSCGKQFGNARGLNAHKMGAKH